MSPIDMRSLFNSDNGLGLRGPIMTQSTRSYASYGGDTKRLRARKSQNLF